MINIVRPYILDESTIKMERELLGNAFNMIEIQTHNEDDLYEAIKNADGIMISYQEITKEMIDRLPRLKIIAFKSIGFNHVDIEYARQKGIAVTNLQRYCIKDVADYTMAMILSLHKRLFDFNRNTHDKKLWNSRQFLDIRRLENLTVGFLGFGNIPKLLRQRLAPYGNRVIAYDPFLDKKTVEDEYAIELLSMDQVLQETDILSLHLPLTPETEEIINAESINKMKDGVILINTARGKLIHEGDLLRALDQGKMRGVALDVLAVEDGDLENHPFSFREDIVLTPHMAYYSQDSYRDGIHEVCATIRHFFQGDYEKCTIVNHVDYQLLRAKKQKDTIAL